MKKKVTGSKIVAIGDLHGHWTELQELMIKLIDEENINPDLDQFVFLGDYVDGGPDTKKVIDWLIQSKKDHPHWKFLYGNHEDLLLDALNPERPIYNNFNLWWRQGGMETTNSYIKDSNFSEYELSLVNPIHVIPKEHLEFLASLDTYYETDKYFFVHGGVSKNQTIEWSKKHMNRYDMIWERDFITSDFAYEKKVIFGHTIQVGNNPTKFLQPWIYPNKIGIDTMAHDIGRITALILPEEKIVQTDFKE